MKQNHFMLVVGLCVALALMVPVASAQAKENDAWNKAGRGICNVLFGWSEVFMQPNQMAAEGERWPIAIAGGSMLGLFKGIERTLVGVYETLTFPVPNPSGTFEPIIEPDFAIPKA